MLDPSHPLAQLLKKDRRYTLEAYVFLFEALHYAQNVLHMGAESPTEAVPRESEASRRASNIMSPGRSFARRFAATRWSNTATWPRRC